MIVLSIVPSIVMAWLTYALIKRPRVTPTRASSVLSLSAFSILQGLQWFVTFDFHYYAALLFGASFVGMCSHKIVDDRQVIVAAIIYTVFYVYFNPVALGVGGALGFYAFVSVVVGCSLSQIVR